MKGLREIDILEEQAGEQRALRKTEEEKNTEKKNRGGEKTLERKTKGKIRGEEGESLRVSF